MKNKLILFSLLALLSSAKLSAQAEAQIDNINKILDTIPYYEIRGLDYSIKYHLPDTTKGKIIDALNRKLPAYLWIKY